MSKIEVDKYITEQENSRDQIENPFPDIKNYIKIHTDNIPKLSGLKAFSLSGILRD